LLPYAEGTFGYRRIELEAKRKAQTQA
jgi:hypothetical protein